ncbi:MAG TPA: NUDIX domain-containing protein [Candidatus Saccharimonadales bacterium]|nr:NUDIX domain-containing protein [Candidatus Saccharimonadales bacterium]
MGKNTQNKDLLTREFSSGGVVIKKNKWLVTRSSSSDLYPETYWRLPKGWIDNETPDVPGPMAGGKVRADEESLQKAALREVKEEGGVETKIIKKIGTEKYIFSTPDRGKILKFVTFYLMEWVKDVPEGHDQETSEIAWMSFEEAYKKLSFSGEKLILKKAKEIQASVA